MKTKETRKESNSIRSGECKTWKWECECDEQIETWKEQGQTQTVNIWAKGGSEPEITGNCNVLCISSNSISRH